MQCAAGKRGADADMTVDGDRHALGQLTHREIRAEVVRNRVESAGVHDPGTGFHGLFVVAQEHPVHELRLAGEVDVVRAGRGARGHQGLSILDIGPDHGDHHAGRLGQRAQRVRRRRVRDDRFVHYG